MVSTLIKILSYDKGIGWGSFLLDHAYKEFNLSKIGLVVGHGR